MFFSNSKVTNRKRYLYRKISFPIIFLFLFFVANKVSGENLFENRLLTQGTETNVLSELKNPKQEAFQQFFGDVVILDPVMVQKVMSDKPGKRHYVDKDNDGKPEEVWFIDNDRRHRKNNLPILVKVIDENGNLEFGKEPDKCGDLWIADWNADGTVDAVIDYEDLDNDGDVDRMSMFFFSTQYGLRVWWSSDDGDDNLLWYDVDYVYDQNLCQYKTHFGGDESFCSFYYSPEKNEWIPFSENPFLFYDRNNDGVTEEVIRLAGHDDNIWSVRWSFDADNDGTLEQPRNFDVGITALAPGWNLSKTNAAFKITENESETFTIRGVPTGLVLNRSTATDYLRQITWGRILLAWDEIDLNRAWNKPNDTIDRWEGVIAAASPDSMFYMPRVGGPDCGPYNKRYELVLEPSKPNEFYFNPSDYRVHIKYSDKAWMNVDYNGDNKSDMYYSWIDTDKDGILDKITLNLGNDGIINDSWNIDISDVKSVPWTFEGLNSVYEPVLAYMPAQKYLLNKTLITVLKSIHKDVEEDPVWRLIQQNMKNEFFTDEVSGKLAVSEESILFYLNLACDRQIIKLKELKAGSLTFWEAFYTARSKNNIDAMIGMLCEEFGVKIPKQDYSEWNSQRKDQSPQQRVAWTENPSSNWRWESEDAAFRFYDGHFDLFGKRAKQLIFPRFAEITKENYHYDRNEWGMDILEIGNSSGCGGLILYVNDVAYPVRVQPKQKTPTFTGHLVEETNEKITLELVAEHIVPDKPYKVRIRPTVVADRDDSSIEVEVEGISKGDKIEIGIGLTRLPEETFIIDKQKGIMGSWGFQNPEIGWIGLGVIFPSNRFVKLDEQPNEHRVVLRYEKDKPLRYHIQSKWLKGIRFSCCPSAQDWEEILQHIESTELPGVGNSSDALY
jgi:hypothetical protein